MRQSKPKTRKSRNVRGGAGRANKASGKRASKANKTTRKRASGAGGAGGAGGGGGASEADYVISGFGRSQDEKYPLLNDLLEEIAEELVDEEERMPLRNMVQSRNFRRTVRLLAIATISQLNDHSPEATNKQEVIAYLCDQQAKNANRPENLIQPEDIQDQIDAIDEGMYYFLSDIDLQEIKAIIRQYMERK
jgi:hypothetical protein